MKLLITTLTMIFMSYGASAAKIELMYKNCKPFQNNGFNFNNLNNEQYETSLMCVSYFRGMLDLGYKNCVYLKASHKNKLIDYKTFETLSYIIANRRNSNLNAVVAGFNKFAENNTDKWDAEIGAYSHIFISEKFPCKINK